MKPYYDDERRKKIADYLKRKAKDEGWFVVTTKLTQRRKSR